MQKDSAAAAIVPFEHVGSSSHSLIVEQDTGVLGIVHVATSRSVDAKSI